MKHISILLTALMAITVGVILGAAQDGSDSMPALLVTALDENGVEQIYQMEITSGEFEQLSDAEFSIEAFDVSENVLAYVSADLLHVEHTDGEIIRKLSRPQELLVTVHISPDEQEVSYNDDTGLYILNIETGEAELLLEQKDFTDPNNPNGVGDGRYYYEAEFLESNDNLIIGVGLWEGRTTGFYDRSSETLTELLSGWFDPDIDIRMFNRVLRLENGQVLLANNHDIRGCFPCGLWQAPSIDDIQNYEPLFESEDLAVGDSGDDFAVGITEMTESAEGVILLLVDYHFVVEDGTLQFGKQLVELYPTTNTLSSIMDSFDEDLLLLQPQFSPDGNFLAFVGSPAAEGYTGYGSPIIYDLVNGTQLEVNFPQEISSIRWSE